MDSGEINGTQEGCRGVRGSAPAGTHPALPHQRLQWRFAQAFALAKLNFVAEATGPLLSSRLIQPNTIYHPNQNTGVKYFDKEHKLQKKCDLYIMIGHASII